jgi:uncharacterized protein
MMRIPIDHIKDAELSFDFEEKPETFTVLADMISKNECKFLAPIKTRLKTIRVGDIVEVEGNIETSVRLTCGRCLKEFETILESHFALSYTRELPGVKDESLEEEVELNAEDMGLIYFRGKEIDLQTGIQEQVVMAFPLRPLCRELCRGLCPKCGTNLNDRDCGCDRAHFDNQFEILKNLKIGRK